MGIAPLPLQRRFLVKMWHKEVNLHVTGAGHSCVLFTYIPLRRLGRGCGCHGDASVPPRRRRDDGNRNIDVGGCDTKSNIDVEVEVRY
jgi:hypothetical protein